MDSLLTDLNAIALKEFICQPVTRPMITHLAEAAFSVIQCDPNIIPPLAPQLCTTATSPWPPLPRDISYKECLLPSLDVFIIQLVKSSHIQVATLMSTLVYLNRLKSRLQPMAKGLRCTAHRILLASIILAAKYLNDSSPKNKNWASYSIIQTEAYNFGFSRAEVNLMEKQLLSILTWELKITEFDLYRELEAFLAPIRQDITDRHIRRQRCIAEERARPELN